MQKPLQLPQATHSIGGRDLDAVDTEAVARDVGLRRKGVLDVEGVQSVSPLIKTKHKRKTRQIVSALAQ